MNPCQKCNGTGFLASFPFDNMFYAWCDVCNRDERVPGKKPPKVRRGGVHKSKKKAPPRRKNLKRKDGEA